MYKALRQKSSALNINGENCTESFNNGVHQNDRMLITQEIHICDKG